MDVGVDGQQAYGLNTGQYKRAVAIARILSGSIPGKLEFTGHSMGGGLASAASLATDRHAVTFNPAGLHPNTLGYNNIPAGKLKQAERLITAYAVRSEPLNTFQDNNPVNAVPELRPLKIGPAAIGFRVALDPKMDGIFSQHGMDHVLAALDYSP